MQHPKLMKNLTSLALVLSLAPTAVYANADLAPKKAALQGILLQKGLAQDAAQLSTVMQHQLFYYLSSILKVDPTQAIASRKIDPLSIYDLSQKETTPQEQQILQLWAKMVAEKSLKPYIEKLITQLKASPTPLAAQLQQMPQEKLEYGKEMLASAIEGVVKLRGLSESTRHVPYLEWSELSARMIEQVNLSTPGMENVLELANSSWIKTDRADILVDGKESFARRDQLIANAHKSIHILTWSIYDDLTGAQLADLLIKKKQTQPQLEIRVIVDGQVAAGPGRQAQLSRMEKAGVEVIRWMSRDLSYVGQHRKMMIVDNKHMVAGGLNFGDVYSHKNSAVQGWRDTDVFIKGAGAQEGNRLFTKIWNDQLKEQPQLPYRAMSEIAVTLDDSRKSDSVEVSLIDHDPRTTQTGSPIMLTVLKAIRESRVQIDIENAYIILFPALKSELQAAINRGVKVRVFTNSGKSVDEPVVSIPILRSARDFVSMGAQVYLKNGTTLHSKLLVVDSQLSMVMSYNFHPRSERLEGEMAFLIRDRKISTELHHLFSKDVKMLGTLVRSVDEIKMPDSPISVPTLRLFFDLL